MEVPREVLDNILLDLDDNEINILKSSSTIINKNIKDVEDELLYWKKRVSNLLGFEIDESIKSDKWRELYNKMIGKDYKESIIEFGNVDIFEQYFKTTVTDSEDFHAYLTDANITLEMFKMVESYILDNKISNYIIYYSGILQELLSKTKSLKLIKYLFSEIEGPFADNVAYELYKAALQNPDRRFYDYLKLNVKISKKRLLKVIRDADNGEIFREEYVRGDVREDVYTLMDAKPNIAKVIVEKIEDFEDEVLKLIRYANDAVLEACAGDPRMTYEFLNFIFFGSVFRYRLHRNMLPARKDSIVEGFLKQPLVNKEHAATALFWVPDFISLMENLNKIYPLTRYQKHQCALHSNKILFFDELKDDAEFILECLGSRQYDKVKLLLESNDKFVKEVKYWFEMIVKYPLKNENEKDADDLIAFLKD